MKRFVIRGRVVQAFEERLQAGSLEEAVARAQRVGLVELTASEADGAFNVSPGAPSVTVQGAERVVRAEDEALSLDPQLQAIVGASLGTYWVNKFAELAAAGEALLATERAEEAEARAESAEGDAKRFLDAATTAGLERDEWHDRATREREACARVVEAWPIDDAVNPHVLAEQMAAAIRART